MSITDTPLFEEVREAIGTAVLIAWDGCHKIYLAMDQIEAGWFIVEYPHTVEDTPEVMLATLAEWWEASCSLRFISAVTNHGENSGIETLIPQFADEAEE